MSVYKISRNLENYYSLIIKNARLFSSLFGNAKKGWMGYSKRFVLCCDNFTGSNECLPDISVWTQGVLVFSPKAKLAVGELIVKCGEFLPIVMNIKSYFLFNTLEKIDESLIDKSNAIEDPDLYGSLTCVKYNEDGLLGLPLFKSITNHYVDVFVLNVLKKLLIEMI